MWRGTRYCCLSRALPGGCQNPPPGPAWVLSAPAPLLFYLIQKGLLPGLSPASGLCPTPQEAAAAGIWVQFLPCPPGPWHLDQEASWIKGCRVKYTSIPTHKCTRTHVLLPQPLREAVEVGRALLGSVLGSYTPGRGLVSHLSFREQGPQAHSSEEGTEWGRVSWAS